MVTASSLNVAVFAGPQLVARGELARVAQAAYARRDESLVTFDETTGRTLDLDLRGTLDDVLARLGPPPSSKPARGRPKLASRPGKSRSPRHWDWLAKQPGQPPPRSGAWSTRPAATAAPPTRCARPRRSPIAS